MDIIHSFDMSGEIANFERMPKDVQSRVKRNVVDVIYESFVVPGDQDYLMARLLAQNGLPRGFYWAAAQAIEKYLKAFLLINGMGVINFKGHPVKDLFDVATKIDISFADLSILPHPSIQINAAVAEHLKRFTVQDFICELEKHGNSDNRYNAFGVEYNTGHLCAMDSLSFHIRGRIGRLPIIYKSFKRLNQDLINTFEKNNPWFQSSSNLSSIEIPNDEFPIQYFSSTATLEFMLTNENQHVNYLALRWLRAKMKFPKKSIGNNGN